MVSTPMVVRRAPVPVAGSYSHHHRIRLLSFTFRLMVVAVVSAAARCDACGEFTTAWWSYVGHPSKDVKFMGAADTHEFDICTKCKPTLGTANGSTSGANR